MIVFRNPGSIDLRSITTFGVSSKEKRGAIGFFGTGLKYAIAILLREGCGVTIITGGQRLEFATEKQQVRVDQFEFVTMNGQPLGFTTELGKTWELWAAFRELWCNCADEGGEALEADHWPDLRDPGEDETLVVVTGEAFRDVWAQRSDIILSQQPLYKHEGVHVVAAASEHAFYRGVRAMKLSNPSLFTYNIQRHVDLTEDRTIKYPWDVNNVVVRGLMECSDPRIIERAVLARKGSYENTLDFSGVVPSGEFMNVVKRHMERHTIGLSPSAAESCRIWLMGQLIDEDKAELSEVDKARLARAIQFCERIGFPVQQFPIRAVDFLGEGVLGKAYEQQILVSRRVFMMGTKMLAGTLIEEFIHLTHRCHDETRDMQNILMDTICSLGEQITGEPL